MKQVRNLGVLGIMVLLLCANLDVATAQQKSAGDTTRHHFRGGAMGDKQHHMGIQGLSGDQQKKIDALGVTFKKETLQLSNQLAEKRTHLHTLQTADKADMIAINSTIDEIGQLQSQIMKKQAVNHEAIRKLLTDDQRVAFDTQKHGGRGMHGKHGGQDKRGHSRN